jgi:hypothetical protein
MALFASANGILGKGLPTKARFDLGNPGDVYSSRLLADALGYVSYTEYH